MNMNDKMLKIKRSTVARKGEQYGGRGGHQSNNRGHHSNNRETRIHFLPQSDLSEHRFVISGPNVAMDAKNGCCPWTCT